MVGGVKLMIKSCDIGSYKYIDQNGVEVSYKIQIDDGSCRRRREVEDLLLKTITLSFFSS